jgi:ABC-type nickel/cobalt efflux system permease component RcnA
MSYTTGTVDDAAALTTEGLMALGYNDNLRVKKMTKYGKDALQQDPLKSERVCVRKHAHAHDHDCTHACACTPTHTHMPIQFHRLYSVKDNVLTLCLQCVPGCAPNVGRSSRGSC